MSADTEWKVKVRKSYTEEITVYAVTQAEAYDKAREEPGVVLVEDVEWVDPENVPNVK
jgi:hypothetical protein